MSRYVKFIFISLIFLLPKLASAATVTFGDKQWEVTPIVTTTTQTAISRSFDLKNLVDHVLFGRSIQNSVVTLDTNTIDQIQTMEDQVNQPVQNAQMDIQDGWATTFVPDHDGQELDVLKLASLLSETSGNITLPVVTTVPQTKLSDLNNIGINQLIATGVSDYTGSSKNRVTNVAVGSSKYNGLIIQPGEEFSFNKYLGDVDAAHGFKPEQVIKNSGIELEFGGGLCQVSTTMFRAAMNAGMPITQRRNHSFAVHYYYPQGTDATIYPGSSDLKFVNNFATPVLVHTYIKAPYVYFEMYGTKDDRQVTFEGPTILEKNPDGSMKTTWTRHVTIDGVTTDYVAKSNYVSAALFKKVDQTSTPNPQAVATPANTAGANTTVTPPTTPNPPQPINPST